jgi:hypothetical protein
MSRRHPSLVLTVARGGRYRDAARENPTGVCTLHSRITRGLLDALAPAGLLDALAPAGLLDALAPAAKLVEFEVRDATPPAARSGSSSRPPRRALVKPSSKQLAARLKGHAR